MQEITLNGRTWKLNVNEVLGRGAYGTVYAGLSPEGTPAALKVLPDDPSADREQLVAPELSGRKNVLPIFAHGEWRDQYVLAMPRASRSLKDLLDDAGGNGLSLAEAMPILSDILSALEAIGGSSAREPVVHRDLKPANILEYGGEWCVADFGIAKYADATTATNTAKFARTAAYASPEQWRGDQTEPRTDIYSWAVIAFEMLTGQIPFRGPSPEDFKEQHLFEEPPALVGMPHLLTALLKRCLDKQPANRWTAAEALDRLATVYEEPSTPTLERLDRIELREVDRRTKDTIRAAKAAERRERRKALAEGAAEELYSVYRLLWDTLKERMPSIVEDPVPLWPSTSPQVTLIDYRDVKLRGEKSYPAEDMPWDRVRPSFDLIAMSGVRLRIPETFTGQAGSEYGLWYCNPAGDDHYRWYEMGWSFTGDRGQNTGWYDPVLQEPRDSLRLLTETGLPWALSKPLTLVDPIDFVERWCDIVADAFEGRLPQHWLVLDPRSARNIFFSADTKE